MWRLRLLLAQQVPGLTSDVVRLERDGTCRLETRLVTSDVHQYLALCQTAPHLPPAEAKVAYEQARALYRGDLLVEPAYEWVDMRDECGLSLRESYRDQYRRITRDLARLFTREGQADRAVILYKSLLRAEPTLEDIVRELYRFYQQLGDLS